MVWKLIYDLSSGQVNSSHLFNKIPSITLNLCRQVHNIKKEKFSNENLQQLITFYNSSQWFNINQKYYLVFEDDMEINSQYKDNFILQLNEIQNALPLDTDICYLGYSKPFDVKFPRVHKLLSKPNYLWQLHAYLLSSSGAKKLLSYLPIDSPVDNFISRLIYEEKLKVNFNSLLFN